MLILLAVALLAGACSCSALLTAGAKKLAPRLGLLAYPQADRYHRSVIPLGGGIAIFGTLAIFIVAAAGVVRFLVAPGHLGQMADRLNIVPADFLRRCDELAVVLICAAILFAVGLWDDRRPLGPFVKLAVQCLVALLAATAAEIRVEFFIDNRIITSAISALWIVVIINSFNFLDNMDGASAGIAAIAGAILFVAAAFNEQVFVGGLAIVFVGTLLGFLAFNFPPASIFMGDAGSLVVGFFVALLTLRTTYYQQDQSGPWYPVLMPLVVMAVPLYDLTSVTLLRLRQGKSPFVGDTQHFSHRLRRRGLTDTQTVLMLYLATLCCGLGATFLYQVNLVGAVLIFAQTFLILAIIAIFESTVRHGKDID
ncbi:MAG: MraY family glycosyltransferase [Sedimentisphaerales bacterium]|jgi:UDP-GlcNAc:undecaprenyl-phosphate GlcNAc-1-phosphate transferase|nr:MraY family glycosyltransferase [Sedimentisphaerales bacterium]NLZ03945.1 undecaprenyl/decaprenyl-phosphate alpha-N-acetylglucosaminyl 1-phosphate transferase [Phycisphaerae bacterium]HNY76637.1 MraY family glycosyltransferase [Sedimentisphaerales bacterium]HOC61756.1 MraY family glycosyltransferase [Sedimentisphaerales bacterium]HOH62588.1 MraY family glycosyltransferase [Sedimentisphaerales bacterium]